VCWQYQHVSLPLLIALNVMLVKEFRCHERERVLHQPASQAIVLADGAPSMDAFKDVRNC
jgi:hypothetical protein